jgi:hypothetical protein
MMVIPRRIIAGAEPCCKWAVFVVRPAGYYNAVVALDL